MGAQPADIKEEENSKQSLASSAVHPPVKHWTALPPELLEELLEDVPNMPPEVPKCESNSSILTPKSTSSMASNSSTRHRVRCVTSPVYVSPVVTLPLAVQL